MEYNVNELIEKRKHLEEKLKTFESQEITANKLVYTKIEMRDSTGKADVIQESKKVTFTDFFNEYAQISNELARIKAAISEYNARVLKDKLFARDEVRRQINCLKLILAKLPSDPTTQFGNRQTDKEGRIILTQYNYVNPMFEQKEVSKRFDELAALERKLNTEIQRLNLNEKVTLD